MQGLRHVSSLLEHFKTVLYLFDEDLKIQVFNSATADMFKQATGNELKPGMKFLDFLGEQDKEKLEPFFQDGINGKKCNFSYHLTVEGRDVYFDVTIAPVEFDGDTKMASCHSHIVSEDRMDKIKLLRSEANLTALIENASDSIWSVDRNIKLLTLNKIFVEGFAMAFGHRLAVGDCPLDYIVPDSLAKVWRDRYMRCLDGEQFTVIDHYEYENLPQFVEISYCPIRIGNRIEGVSCITRDITQLKLSEHALKEVVATKDKFFSIIAHDLKGPIANIHELTRLLTIEDPAMTEFDRNRTISYLAQTTNSVKYLLDNLLHWARTQQDMIAISPEPIALKEFIDQTLEPYMTSAKLKSIEVENSVAEKLIIKADKPTMGLIIANLFNNATKYTNPKGKIFLDAKVNKDFVEFIIKDTGIGIDKDTIDQVLSNKDVKSTPGTNNEKGTGLGLLLSHEFIKNNGGELKIVSQPGEGSTFSFTIPKGE